MPYTLLYLTVRVAKLRETIKKKKTYIHSGHVRYGGGEYSLIILLKKLMFSYIKKFSLAPFRPRGGGRP